MPDDCKEMCRRMLSGEITMDQYGDLIATWTAPVDWYLGNVLGVGKNFHTAPSDMIRTQCEELLENSAKLAAWTANRAKFEAFLAHFDEFKERVAPWVKKPEYIADCMHRANAPCRYSVLNFPVDEKTVRWAITNCHLMRNRFSVIDLLHFTGVWNDEFVQMLLDRADAMDAGL